MATVDSNAFELERRGFQWSMNNTLDDGQSSLLYDGDPNSIITGNTAGETKLYSLLPGATYFQSSGEWWLKTSTPNTWNQITTNDVLNTRLDALTASMQSSGGISVTLSNDPGLPATVVDCFNIAEYRTAKLIMTGYSNTEFHSSEVLITYYGVTPGAVLIQGVQHTQYGILGTPDLITVGVSLVGSTVRLTITPSTSGIHMDIHKITV
jgi:hypothetical protein